MDTVVSLCYCKISLREENRLSATQLRSFIGYKFIQDTEFHHHDDNPYRYPLIQYKRIKNNLYILGIAKFSDLVFDRISGLQSIMFYDNIIPITNIVFEKNTHTITDSITQYQFSSPWIALNKENYTEFKTLNRQFRKGFLENILVGSLLSMLKGLGIRTDYRLYVQIKQYKEIPVVAHRHGFSGFYARFITNLLLPEYIGIGKSVSKGFGIIQKVK